MNTYIYVDSQSQKELFRCNAKSLPQADEQAKKKNIDLETTEVSIGIGLHKKEKNVTVLAEG